MSAVPGELIVLAGSYAAAADAGLRAFRLGDEGLVALTGWEGVANPSFIAVSPSGNHLYAVSETEDGAVYAFEIGWDGTTPALIPINSAPTSGDHPCHVGVDPHGRWLAVANYGSGNVAVLDLDGDGAIGMRRDVHQFEGGSVHPARQRGPHAHSATPIDDGRRLVVADLGGDRLVTLEVGQGGLVPCGAADVAPGAGPRHAAVRQRDRLVAVANELDGTLSTYRLGTAGELTRLATARVVPDDAPETLVAHVAMSSDGSTVFVSNRGQDTIASLDIDEDGRLGEPAWRSCGGSWPRHFALLPGDDRLAVANERSDAIDVIDLDGCRLATAAMPAPTCVVVLTPPPTAVDRTSV